MYHFATYFDKNYLPKGLVLFDSLAAHHEEFKLHVLCLDDHTYEFLTDYSERLVPFALSSLEAIDKELLAVKENRSLIEYYFTTTACWCLHLLQNDDEIDYLSYVDADLYFYDPVEAIFDEMRDHSVLIIPHHFPEENRDREIYGKYNVGYIAWKNNIEGRACLLDWREKCLAWCYDRIEEGRFADQKYLDEWPLNDDFNTLVTSNLGLNVAYYNFGVHPVTMKNGHIYVGNWRLIFYHFHKVQKVHRSIYRLNLLSEQAHWYKGCVKSIYYPYLDKLRTMEKRIQLQVSSIRYDTQNIDLHSLVNILFFEFSISFLPFMKGVVRLEDNLRPVFTVYRYLKNIMKKDK